MYETYPASGLWCGSGNVVEARIGQLQEVDITSENISRIGAMGVKIISVG